jgi:hypothetical protein
MTQPDMFSDARWNGIRIVAESIGATPNQVRMWRKRRAIPGAWHLRLLAGCLRRGVSLSSDELLAGETSRAA